MADLEQYAENSASSLLYLALECGDERGEKNPAASHHDTSHAASHLGKVYIYK